MHAYVGIVGAVFVLGKVRRIGLRHQVTGTPHVVPWHRWMSWSLLVLYAAILASGVLLLLPVRGPVYADLVELHLMTSVWALLPTTWHVLQYGQRAAPYVGRLLGQPRGWRFWAGIGLALAPALVLAAQPRAASQLPQVMGGGAWSRAGLGGVPLDRLTTADGGDVLVAAGRGLYVSGDGRRWTQLDVPVAAGAAGTAEHLHGEVPHAGVVRALAAGRDGVYVATAQGLFLNAALSGPTVSVGQPGTDVRAIAVVPGVAGSLWTASSAGLAFTADGGRTWASLGAGLGRPADVTAMAFLGGRFFAGDPTGVFEWTATSRSWARSSDQGGIVGLAASPDGRELLAVSGSGELRRLDAGGWRALAAPGAGRHHGGHEHGSSPGLVSTAGRLYAAGTPDGVSASADGGRTWTQLGSGAAGRATGQLAAFHGALWAATGDGVYRFPLLRSAPPSAAWWAALVAAALLAGSTGLALAAMERRRPVIVPPRRREESRPFMGVEEYLARLASAPQAPALRRRAEEGPQARR